MTSSMLSNVTFENYQFQRWVTDPNDWWYWQTPHAFRMLSHSDQFKPGEGKGEGRKLGSSTMVGLGQEGEWSGWGLGKGRVGMGSGKGGSLEAVRGWTRGKVSRAGMVEGTIEGVVGRARQRGKRRRGERGAGRGWKGGRAWRKGAGQSKLCHKQTWVNS